MALPCDHQTTIWGWLVQPLLERAFDSGGSCRHLLGSSAESWGSLLERRFPVAIEHAGANLQEEIAPRGVHGFCWRLQQRLLMT